MGILNLLDTEYIDEFKCDSSYTTTDCATEDSTEDNHKVSKPNSRYTYRSMLEIMFPD